MEDDYSMTAGGSIGSPFDPYAAKRQAAQQAQLRQGYATNARDVNVPTPAGMTERIQQRLAGITAAVSHAHNVLNEKHVTQFGQPAPSGVAELRSARAETGPGYAEAAIFAILDQLQERSHDLVAAAESLTARI